MAKHHRARKHTAGEPPHPTPEADPDGGTSARHVTRPATSDATPTVIPAGVAIVPGAEHDGSAPAPIAGSDAVRRSARRIPAPAGSGRTSPAGHAGSGRPARRAVALVERLTWERLVADESERQRRYGRPSAIVLADVRGLDRVVVLGGPRAIDRVVPACGDTLASIARGSDRITRLTDGRFGILLRETDADGAGRYAARARTACDPWLAALPWPVRLELRWASPEGSEDLVGALRRVERELAAMRPGEAAPRPHGADQASGAS